MVVEEQDQLHLLEAPAAVQVRPEQMVLLQKEVMEQYHLFLDHQ
jgi:hypothetical protein